jgi:hypothetical protein
MNRTELESEIRRRAHHVDATESLLKRVPRLRHHMLTPEQKLELASLHESVSRQHNDPAASIPEHFVSVVCQLEEYVPGLFSPPIEEPKLPRPIKDPLTGDLLRMPSNMTERAKLKKHYPDWYDYLEKLEKSPVSLAIEQAEKRAEYEARKNFYATYTPSTNPFITGNHIAQARVVKADPVRAELLRQEAKPVGGSPFAVKLTTFGRIAKENPELHTLLKGVTETAERWANLEREQRNRELDDMLEAAQARGWTLLKPGQTGIRHADQRSPMKVAPYGSPEQARLQREHTRVTELARKKAEEARQQKEALELVAQARAGVKLYEDKTE